MTLRTGSSPSNDGRRRAFTLIEMILVMALLVMAAAIVTPRLLAFFSARSVDSEVRRFVALIHYGQSRAVSEGVPMILWVDARAGTYGLREETGYTDGDKKATDYALDPDLRIKTMNGVQPPPTTPGGVAAAARAVRSLPGIHFTPDGGITPQSAAVVTIQKGAGQPAYIVQTANRMSYEIADQNTAIARMRR